ncbi:MAG: flagellar hook-associated protein FlgL [Hydrogenophaga sp.]|jgi:flagellar hook-associated protein 3 FlgL|uniref:flagellar hook-associated protein FlgL n=1 Tax=Hydrogenophaga sp. TaxID=1904254 RepID=UPI000ED104D3|nr:flagellar hook-associated protein FlgL [Hydrogenophaga sp.]RJP68355.1 MAG: flagellar hook-associated protein 3 [Comamonadaceae bacterium]
MRVSTANSYDNTIALLTRRQAELAAQQERVASGMRVLKPSDDPVAATLAETAANRLSRTTADLRALDASRASLEQAESGLAESGDLIQKVRDLLVTAGNATFTDAEREDVAKQLEGLREQLIAVANRKDNAGRTLYGGLGGSSVPFVDLYGPSGNGVQFEGLRGQAAAGNSALPQALDGDAIWMRVPQGNGTFTLSLPNTNTGNGSTTMGEVTDAALLTGDDYDITFADVGGVIQYTVTNVSTGTPVAGHTGQPYVANKTIEFDGMQLELRGTPAAGDSVELRPVTAPTDIFSVVQNAVNALRYNGPNESAHHTQAMARALTEVDAGHDRVLAARGRAGEWLNRADSLDTQMEDRSVDLKAEQSRLEELDPIKGISELETMKLGLEAAIKTYAQVQRLSLFSVIN